jgi:hypothetical protein
MNSSLKLIPFAILMLGFACSVSMVPQVRVRAQAGAATPITLGVEASAGLPGFHIRDLPEYLASHMADAKLTDWHFEPVANNASRPNRVVWSFKLNPYAGGEVRSFTRTPGGRRPVTLEARLYLNGEYQTLVEGQAMMVGGPNDPVLAAAVTNLAGSLLGPSGAYRAIDAGRRGALPAH